MDRKGERMRGWNTDTQKGTEEDGKRERDGEKETKNARESMEYRQR